MNRLTKAAVLGLVLATAAPMAAQAQDRDDRRENRRDYREDRRDDRQDNRRERRDDRRDWRQGEYDNRREYRQDRRDDRRDFREERREDRRDFRRDQRWDRNNRDWWRGRDDFRDYRGARNGYWYAPSYGYYRVEPRYYGQRWQRGAYLPHSYRNYYVRDPYAYNLRPAPRGYRYVHAGNDIVLIAIATGLIASVLSGVY
jgi:Ni/Co efflux regulator RcnB